MAEWHLSDLRTRLKRRGWDVDAELPGDDHAVSATWRLRRPGDANTPLIDFDGLDENGVLPLDRSYGCRVRGKKQELYFTRRGEGDSAARLRWEKALDTFVVGLENVHANGAMGP